MSDLVTIVLIAIAMIEAMAIVAWAAWYGGRRAKVAEIVEEYIRQKEEGHTDLFEHHLSSYFHILSPT